MSASTVGRGGGLRWAAGHCGGGRGGDGGKGRGGEGRGGAHRGGGVGEDGGGVLGDEAHQPLPPGATRRGHAAHTQCTRSAHAAVHTQCTRSAHAVHTQQCTCACSMLGARGFVKPARAAPTALHRPQQQPPSLAAVGAALLPLSKVRLTRVSSRTKSCLGPAARLGCSSRVLVQGSSPLRPTTCASSAFEHSGRATMSGQGSLTWLGLGIGSGLGLGLG